MFNINLVIISGTVVGPPEISKPKTYQLGKFTLAVKNDPSKDTISYFDVEAWAKTVEKVQEFVQQGKRVCVKGKLQRSSWDNKETGKKDYKFCIVANDISGDDDQDAPAPTQQPDFMQDQPTTPPLQHQLPPKRTRQEPEEGKVIVSSERDFANYKKEPAPTASTSGVWVPPLSGEPPF